MPLTFDKKPMPEVKRARVGNRQLWNSILYILRPEAILKQLL